MQNNDISRRARKTRDIRHYSYRVSSLVIIRYVSSTSQRQTLRSQDEPFELLQNNIFGTKHIGEIKASCSQSQRVAGVLTLHDSLQLRRDAIGHVHLSCSESPTVADSRSASQGYHTPSDSLQLASCRQSRRFVWCGLGLTMKKKTKLPRYC